MSMSELVWFNNPEELLSRGTAMAGFVVTELYSGPFALVEDDLDSRSVQTLVAAKVLQVKVGDDEYTPVVLCRMVDGNPQWAIYCGDSQVSGVHRLDGKNLAQKLRMEGKVATSVANTVEASGWVGLKPEQASCSFFRMYKRNGKFCSHTQAALAELEQPELQVMATQLSDWLAGAAVVAPAAALSPEEAAFFDAAFIQHVLLAGERGSGKTFLARRAAQELDAVYLEMQLHPSMEPWEFRAHDRACDGKVYTVLGKLAEAVYWIQQGKRVVLCLDEYFNMNPMYTTVINSPLSLTANDTYLIETGRILDQGGGVGIPEVVEVPSDMLWVVATTNVGARYMLDRIPPSVRARFLIILMNSDAARTRSILESKLAEYDMPLEMAECFENFMVQCNPQVEAGTLQEEVTTRMAANVIRYVHKRSLRTKKRPTNLIAWKKEIKKQMLLEMAQVVSFDSGPYDDDQKKLYETAVNTCF